MENKDSHANIPELKATDIIIVILSIIIIISVIVANRPTKEDAYYNAILIKELKKLSVPSNTQIREIGFARASIFVSADFVTKQNYGYISQFYDKEFARNGWQFIEQKNYGERERYYNKVPFQAVLAWGGDKHIPFLCISNRSKFCTNTGTGYTLFLLM